MSNCVHIALEGIDGSGKTTQLERLSHSLLLSGVSHTVFRYTDKHSQITSALIERWRSHCGNGERELSRAERLVQEVLYSVNARHNWRRVDRTAKLIVADRSILTAFVSHKELFSRPVFSWYFVRILEAGIRLPDAVILLDTDPRIASERLARRGVGRNADENIRKASMMRESYNSLRVHPPSGRLGLIKWRVVDGGAAGSVVERDVLAACLEILAEYGIRRSDPVAVAS